MRLLAAFAVALLALATPIRALADPVAIPVTVAPAAAPAPLAGRLIVFAQRVEPGAATQTQIDSSPFAPTNTAVAAREVHALTSGQTALVDGEADAFPSRFSDLPAGTYRFQAVLDRNHDYNYGGRGAGDIVSPVIEVQWPGALPTLVLSETLPEPAPDAFLANVPEAERAATRTAWRQAVEVDFVSPTLSAFWGRLIHMRGWIALPPGYRAAGPSFPVAYSTHGFGGSLRSQRVNAAQAIRRMAAGEWPPMIWVFLDESSPTGTHEFADSANNGPWGEALTTELIPWLESRYRMDARPSGRFLTGHSSGGWATLWLQVRYPELFGGTWPTAPDASDFHDFTNIDIYATNANAYRTASGDPIPLIRNEGRMVATLEQFARLETVLGAYGGQFASFDWVFSPKGPDGRPLQLFDRVTGAVDPQVAAHWRENYDIAHIVARDWARLRPHLHGKIHVTVGTADTFYLDGSARRLQAVLERLGAGASFTYVDGGTHFSLYRPRPDGTDLMRDIAQAMHAVARPGERAAQ